MGIFRELGFQRRKAGGLYRQDEVKPIRHDEFLETDYQLMVDIGCVGIRDAARWYVSHPKPHVFDWTWLDRVVKAADKYKLTLYLDLWHYGYPDWLDIMSADARSISPSSPNKSRGVIPRSNTTALPTSRPYW